MYTKSNRETEKFEKKHEKIMNLVRSSSRGSSEANSGVKLPEDNFDNLEYFLKVIKMEKYAEVFQADGIKTIAQLKSNL